MSCLSCARSFSESSFRNGQAVPSSHAVVPGTSCPWITRPLIRHVAAMLADRPLQKISRVPTFNRREGPSVRKTALAGTCSERCRRLAA